MILQPSTMSRSLTLFPHTTLFRSLVFNYIGPIVCHDLDALVPTLENLKQLGGLQVLHVVTKKGQGYKLAEADPVLYHGPGKFDPTVGIQKPDTPPRKTFSSVFGDWLCDMEIGRAHV